jgi:hypothetical protein
MNDRSHDGPRGTLSELTTSLVTQARCDLPTFIADDGLVVSKRAGRLEYAAQGPANLTSRIAAPQESVNERGETGAANAMPAIPVCE